MNTTHITLEPVDGRKSFYGKAEAIKQTSEDKTVILLRSYDSTSVARITNGVLELLTDWNYSQTTRRHLRSFAATFGVEDQLETLIKAEKKRK